MQTNNANYKYKKDIISMLKLKAFVHIKTQKMLNVQMFKVLAPYKTQRVSSIQNSCSQYYKSVLS